MLIIMALSFETISVMNFIVTLSIDNSHLKHQVTLCSVIMLSVVILSVMVPSEALDQSI
jgi:hypothetical protein